MTCISNNEWGKNQYQNLSNGKGDQGTIKRSIVSFTIVILSTILLTLFFWNVNHHVTKTYVLTIDTQQPILHITSKKFLSFGLDSSLLRNFKKFPIQDDKFVNLSQHLSPAYVRYGGTSADCLFFNETALESTMNAESTDFQEDISNFTITGNDFMNLYEFTKKSDLRMMFDLNVLIRLPDGSWDSRNAQNIINFAKSHDMDLDWQLGNEPNSFHHSFGRNLTAEQLARDYYQLRELLNASGYQSSILVGPEANHIGDENHRAENYIAEFLDKDLNSVDFITWHQYYLNGRIAQLQDFLNTSTFDYLPRQIKGINDTINITKQKIKMWISETSTAYGSGAPGLSDRYVAGFLWLDKLGISALLGVSVVVRQSLFGGHYAMVGPDIAPNPDWWVSVMYKQLVSEKVLQLSIAENHPKLRMYAHCSPESALINRVPSVTLYGMNLDSVPAKIALLSGKKINAKIFLYVLTSKYLKSREIEMNGNTLRLEADGSLPPFKPVIMNSWETISLPAYSMVFMTIHGLEVPACRISQTKD